MDEIQGIRVNKYLSEIGFCSRREADKLIELGRVTINDSKPQIGAKVTLTDKVKVDGRLVSNPEDKHIYLAFNKPVGIVSTTDAQEPDNIIDYIGYPKRIFPVGRLDKFSEGLIFMTSDGDIVNKILRARNNHEKEYVVTVDKPITDDFIHKMANGIPILGATTKKCKVEQINKSTFNIVLTQGMNRQIRRMCEYLNYDVLKLKRVRIMNIALNIPTGQWRDLTDTELKEINQLVSSSSNVQKGSSGTKPKSSSPKKLSSKSMKPKASSKKSSGARINKSKPKDVRKTGSKRSSGKRR